MLGAPLLSRPFPQLLAGTGPEGCSLQLPGRAGGLAGYTIPSPRHPFLSLNNQVIIMGPGSGHLMATRQPPMCLKPNPPQPARSPSRTEPSPLLPVQMSPGSPSPASALGSTPQPLQLSSAFSAPEAASSRPSMRSPPRAGPPGEARGSHSSFSSICVLLQGQLLFERTTD